MANQVASRVDHKQGPHSRGAARGPHCSVFSVRSPVLRATQSWGASLLWGAIILPPGAGKTQQAELPARAASRGGVSTKFLLTLLKEGAWSSLSPRPWALAGTPLFQASPALQAIATSHLPSIPESL